MALPRGTGALKNIAKTPQSGQKRTLSVCRKVAKNEFQQRRDGRDMAKKLNVYHV